MDSNLAPLLFVIACGGNSSRMGVDKSLIFYHELPQRYHLYSLINKAGFNVCLSVNTKQSASIRPEYRYVIDHSDYNEHGPVSGLLSVHEEYPNHAIFYIGCDYPALVLSDLLILENNRESEYEAIASSDEPYTFPEPLLCIYEPEILVRILNNFNHNKFSLMESLAGSKTLLVKSRNAIRSIDTPEERETFIQHQHLNS